MTVDLNDSNLLTEAPVAELPIFRPFPKIPRLFRDMVVTEKIDGTNACVLVTDDGRVFAQSRKRMIFPHADNFGFAQWVKDNAEELRELGPGHHFGEWYGQGIQRGYGLDHKRFALFRQPVTEDGLEWAPACCGVVPILTRYTFDVDAIRTALNLLELHGSTAVPGFMEPEGICVYHTAAGQLFKVLIENDEVAKSQQVAA